MLDAIRVYVTEAGGRPLVYIPPKSRRRRIRKKCRKDRRRWCRRWAPYLFTLPGRLYVDPHTFKKMSAALTPGHDHREADEG